jgi:hypothetical protein
MLVRALLAASILILSAGAAQAGCIMDPASNALRASTAADAALAATQNAAPRRWFINNDELQFGADFYGKFGLPRVLEVGDVQYDRMKDGTPFFKAGGDVQVLYALSNAQSCEFQPYQLLPEYYVLRVTLAELSLLERRSTERTATSATVTFINVPAHPQPGTEARRRTRLEINCTDRQARVLGVERQARDGRLLSRDATVGPWGNFSGPDPAVIALIGQVCQHKQGDPIPAQLQTFQGMEEAHRAYEDLLKANGG